MSFTGITTTHKPQVLISTHDGTFHSDEVFACYMLKLLPELQNDNIIRHMDTIDDADILVNVCWQYDHDHAEDHLH